VTYSRQVQSPSRRFALAKRAGLPAKSNSSRVNGWAVLIVPGTAFLLAFFFFPVVQVAIRSLTDPSPANYLDVRSTLYVTVLGTTFRIAFVVTVTCLLLAYPYAYVMYRAPRAVAAVMTVVVLLPFLSSILVRTYAWTVLLQDVGVINSLLRDAGLIDRPLGLMRNTLGVVIGLTHVLLPFMVFPIYSVMRRIDPELSTAASSLGAAPFKSFCRVFLPLSLRGVFAGCLLVFISALGSFITPALLGSPRNTMIGQLIVLQVNELFEFGIASALAITVLVVTLVLLGIGSRLVHLPEIFGGGEG
jgi:putative spermidine/putrescine transport system permease protein